MEQNTGLRFEYTAKGTEALVPDAGVQGRVLWAFEGEGKKTDLPGAAGEDEVAAVLQALERTDFRPKAGKVQEIHLEGAEGPIYVAGLGRRDSVDGETLRVTVGAVQKRTREAGVLELGLPLPGCLDPSEEGRVIAEGLALSAYRFTTYLDEEEALRRRRGNLARVVLAATDGEGPVRSGVERGLLTARAVSFARDLVNTPSIDKKPEHLARRARTLTGDRVEVEVWEEEKIRAEGMGAFLGVAAGSQAPPRLIHLVYRPEGSPRRKVAFVGKGVTFDSGGLSLKPAAAMEDMKIDMAGAAAVLGLFSVLPELAPPVEVHGVIAATENMPSGTAIRPGDVLRSMKGKTIEVLNTDAEGRLTLADALAFACRQGVEEMVDLATLTGACMIALGAATGLWGRPDSYRDKILGAAGLAGDRTWPMPLVDDYREQLKSQVADIKNIAGRGGGAITAALFLSEFVDEGVEWCHMDIAGSASTDKDLPTCPTGGTGAGVGTLIRHLETFMEE